ncbi:degenerin del-1-like isoform X2 [Zootermopsis nevadensis]|nr:degenerin del-1-like isoform X2 [Zootermopsis nevadensis]
MIITVSSYKDFREHSISFAVETTYLRWNTTFPAFTVCEEDDPEYVWEEFKKNHPNATDKIGRILEEIVYYKGICNSCEECNQELDCSVVFDKKNFEVFALCKEIFTFCEWNGQTFDCCANFLPLITDTGTCFTINSIHTRQDPNRIKMISNRETGPGTLTIGVVRNVLVCMHSSSDVCTSSHERQKKWNVEFGESWTVLFNVLEIVNDPLVHKIPITRRECRFPEEKPDHYKLFKYYSYSTCVLECQVLKMLEHCKCINHILYPAVSGNFTQCDINGIKCLNEIYLDLVKLRAKHSENENEPGIICDCSADCKEPDQFVIHVEKKETKKESSDIKFVMQTLPNERLRRNVIRSKLDLVVSLGGIAGLFLGASLISAVELLVHVFIRIWTAHSLTGHSNVLEDIPRQRKKCFKKPSSIVQYTSSESGKKLPYYGKDYGVATVFI